MNTYLLIFVTALGVSLTLTPIVRRLCERYGWVDVPRDTRRLHRSAVPRLGGVAIFASFVIALVTLIFFDNNVTRALFEDWGKLLRVLLPATLVFLCGIYDDLYNANPRLKFIAQVVAGSLLYALGVRIEGVSLPLFGSVALPAIVGFAVTVLWTVAISNAFNLIDGIDGLAAGSALFAALVMLVVALVLGHPVVVVCALAISGSLVGFLRYNFNPASIFMGDSGSLFLGFTLAALSIQGAQKASTIVAVTIPLLAFGLPVVDTGVAVLRRFVGGRPLFQGDREHIHHMLLARGWSQRRVVLVLFCACAFFAMLALLSVGHIEGRTTGLLLVVAGGSVVIGVGRLRYHEVDEIGASMRRNVAERRLRAINNIRVRRAGRAMSEAQSLAGLFGAVQEMLDFSEFVYATVQLGRGGDAERNQAAVVREAGAASMRGVEVRGGMICWSWERGDIEATDIIGSGRFWSLRMPLSTESAGWGYINLYRELESDALLLDINYLCSFFQSEMAKAAERVLAPQTGGEAESVLSAVG